VAPLVQQDYKELLEQLAQQAQQDPKVPLDLLVPQDHKDLRVQLDLPELLVLVQQVRRD
jgi:hypothetical protein